MGFSRRPALHPQTATVLIDQYALAEAGADRGLGRYASALWAGAQRLSGVSAEALRRTSATGHWPDVVEIQREIAKLRLDNSVAYHSTSVYHLPLIKDRPWICSIQDIIPLDLSAYRQLGIKSRILFANARRADLIVANSEYTAKRIAERLGVPPRKIAICPLPISGGFSAEPSQDESDRIAALLREKNVDANGPFVVALADMRTPDPRKRYHWIDQIGESLGTHSIPMIVTGRGATVESFPHCTVLPALSDGELSALYGRATAMYYPTAYEGQGLPPLEAMISGCPVVAYRNTSVEEVVGSPEFLLVDPAPWQQQNFEASLDAAAKQLVVERIQTWATSEAALQSARSEARNLAAVFCDNKFEKDLLAIYSSKAVN